MCLNADWPGRSSDTNSVWRRITLKVPDNTRTSGSVGVGEQKAQIHRSLCVVGAGWKQQLFAHMGSTGHRGVSPSASTPKLQHMISSHLQTGAWTWHEQPHELHAGVRSTRSIDKCKDKTPPIKSIHQKYTVRMEPSVQHLHVRGGSVLFPPTTRSMRWFPVFYSASRVPSLEKVWNLETGAERAAQSSSLRAHTHTHTHTPRWSHVRAAAWNQDRRKKKQVKKEPLNP